MCIYYKGRSDLTYTGKEHVIPAGLGGLAKLPNDYVSDQFNNDISKLERDFLRESIIANMRQILGPGNRGRLTEKHETKSKIHVMRDLPNEQSFSLGYIKKGKPYLIPFVVLNTVTGAIDCGFNNKDDFNLASAVADFQAQCEGVSELRFRSFIDNELPDDIVLLGIEKGIEDKYDAFFVKNSSNGCTMNTDLIKGIGNAIANQIGTPSSSKNNVVSHLTGKWNDEYFRLYGKMGFNILAHLKGKEFIEKPCFDVTRNWIASGGENKYANIINEPIASLKNPGINWPEHAHIFLFLTDNSSLYLLCGLYNANSVRVKLNDSMQLPHFYDGFICDWMNRREFHLQEYIANCAVKIAGQI